MKIIPKKVKNEKRLISLLDLWINLWNVLSIP